ERHGRADPFGPLVQVLARPGGDRDQPSAHDRINLSPASGRRLARVRSIGSQPHHHVPAERGRGRLVLDLSGELAARRAIGVGDQRLRTDWDRRLSRTSLRYHAMQLTMTPGLAWHGTDGTPCRPRCRLSVVGVLAREYGLHLLALPSGVRDQDPSIA